MKGLSLRFGDDVGRMVRSRGGRVRFWGLTLRSFGFGIVRYDDAPELDVERLARAMKALLNDPQRTDEYWRREAAALAAWYIAPPTDPDGG